MRKLLSAGVGLIAISAVIACANVTGEAALEPAVSGPETGSWGYDDTAFDMSVDPGDDFFRYANGAWLDAYEIPADRDSYGIFTALRDRSDQQVRAIIEELSAADDAGPGSVEQQVGDFFTAWMNTEAMNEAGIAPLAGRIAEIQAIATAEDLQRAFTALDNQAPFGLGVIPDPADTTRYAVFLGQGGLGLPDRDYYLSNDERMVGFRAAYRDYIVEIFELAGLSAETARADAIVDLETRLAQSHWTRSRSRRISEIYNPMSRDELQALSPAFDWTLIAAALGLDSVDTIVVAQTTAIAEASEILTETPVETWRAYLLFHLIDAYTGYLGDAFDQASFNFYSRTLRGTLEPPPRWERGISLLNARMGEAVGQVYVERHFPAGHRAMMEELVANLRAAFAERLQNLDWMDDETRATALAKLDTFEPRIGHPDQWIDYSSLVIDPTDPIGNAMRSLEFSWDLQVERLGGPVDRELWSFNAQTVNASYNPLLNQITFPAAILQPPFFDPLADPAVNYGAIGGVIGHEISHGFDDQGRQFDPSGLIRDWWTAGSDARFRERANELIAQYNSYAPIDGMTVNGELTLGENIGDLGGLQMAYAAYQRHIAQHGEPPIIDGFTGEQRFFLAWAQVWRGMYREDALRERLLTVPHSPSEFRVNGVVRNMDAWYEAFDVAEGDALYLPPERRVSIW